MGGRETEKLTVVSPETGREAGATRSRRSVEGRESLQREAEGHGERERERGREEEGGRKREGGRGRHTGRVRGHRRRAGRLGATRRSVRGGGEMETGRSVGGE